VCVSGIAALYGPGAKDKLHLVEEMLSRLEHRGPDRKWTFARDHVVLGHRARQTEKPSWRSPASRDEATVVVADAEICDSQALAESSPSATGRVASAEAIARAHEQFGTACPCKLDGAFSFVASGSDSLLVARDPLGAQPLYWGNVDRQLAFASELKALVGIAEDIKEFPPGHYFDSGSGLGAYYAPPSDIPTETDAEAAAESIRQQLDAAVQRAIQPGVSTGVLLSGGLDSSVIAAIAKRHCTGMLAFTAGTKSGQDLPFARRVAEHLDIVHEEYIYDIKEMLEVLPTVIYHLESFDAPLVRSAVPNYLVSRLAAPKVDVVLIGEGGDENFGGYHHLKRLASPEKQHKALLMLFAGLHNNGFMRTYRMNAADRQGAFLRQRGGRLGPEPASVSQDPWGEEDREVDTAQGVRGRPPARRCLAAEAAVRQRVRLGRSAHRPC